MDYPERVKSHLWSDISEMSQDPGRFAKNPGVDFTRKRKLDFENLMRFLISMQSGTTADELLKYFNDGIGTVSNSAFYQQRGKLSGDAFPSLLRQFNSHYPLNLFKGAYYLVACDGTGFNIFRDPGDPDTFHPPSGCTSRGFNMLHVVALYDILSRRYLDCEVQPGRKKNEFKAICDFADRFSYDDGIPIFTADRGLASYNFYAHAKEKGMFHLVRAKDAFVRRLLKLDALPDSIDACAEIILSRSQSKKKWGRPDLADQYRYICPAVAFDYIAEGSYDEYPLTLRVVRFELADGVFANIVTNLPADGFPPGEIKHLYHLRWGIETSFRDLKHTIGAVNFHSKKPEYIEQEIWARMILFNFCALITAHAVIAQNGTKHTYQVNLSMAMKICHRFIRIKENKPIPDVVGLIGSFTLPIRPDRNYARQHRFQVPASFCYRFS